MRGVIRVAVLFAFALVVSACSSDTSSTASGASSASEGGDGAGVSATVKDFAISLDRTDLTSGEVSFNIHNDGPSTHEFVVVKTDAAPDELPLNEAGDEVDEEQIDGVGEQEDIAASSDVTLSLTLDPGSYVVICNITGHYNQGMHAGFTVS
jgi:uncharacterized cupredoxin-like copper-binding protein